MSVYYEALHSGRLAAVGWSPSEQPAPVHRGGTRLSCKGIRRALRAAKRDEAEERNEETLYERTRSYRRATEKAVRRV